MAYLPLTWFKDYLYISLGGNRVSVPRWYLNLFLVFLVSGFWHGANWTFIIWGALHGSYLIVALLRDRFFKIRRTIFSKRFPKLNRAVQVTTVFTLVTFAWIFFRAASVQDAFLIIGKLFSSDWGAIQYEHVFTKFSMVLSFGLIVFLFWAESKVIDSIIHATLEKKYKTSVVFGIAILSMILLLGVFQKLSFIYFQF